VCLPPYGGPALPVAAAAAIRAVQRRRRASC
jgi:hypothetical protein